ncbi:uncharacterized protein LOC132791589 isoform X2 [Drosophila nasuta]|uniref:uncharacterized protein LOC132791589 isoform X2 n=1 Tax=Drosophila nasuta TaxID=42062 RepID=UPI00295EA134|nr:uncharacterized protein LOC132791589 isoform X2 [Drosophila nasuta]
MDIKNMLILSPTTLTFQAPFPFYQKRQLSLLNLSEKIMVYSIEVDNPKLFEVMPLRGVLNTYATIELAILMKPVTGNLPASRLTVKYMEKPENYLESLPQNWSGAYTTQVDMLLMNYVADEKDLKNMAVDGDGSPDLDDLIKRLQRYKPVCTNCCLKRNNPKANESKSRLRQLFWPLCLAALSVGVIVAHQCVVAWSDDSANKIF